MKFDSTTDMEILRRQVLENRENRLRRIEDNKHQAKIRQVRKQSAKRMSKRQYEKRCEIRKMELEKLNKIIERGGEKTEKLVVFAQLLQMPPVDLNNAKEVSNRVVEYINICAKEDIKPGIEGMCLALGIARSTYNNILAGKTNNESEVLATFRQIHQFLTAEMEYYMQEGKITPVCGIFLSKNNFGYRDQVETIVTKEEREKVDADKIREKYMLK